jgi:hypothetical protein
MLFGSILPSTTAVICQQYFQQQWQQQQVSLHLVTFGSRCIRQSVVISSPMVSRGVWVSWLLWLALLGSALSAAAAAAAANTTAAAQADTASQQAAQHNSSSKTVGFYIDEGFFLEGDTEILRAYIAGKAVGEVSWHATDL